MVRIGCDVLVIGGWRGGMPRRPRGKKGVSRANVTIVSSVLFKPVAAPISWLPKPGDQCALQPDGDGDNADVYYSDIIKTGGGLADPALCGL
jgi:fumarate reductase (CoM/CoB) subunit A